MRKALAVLALTAAVTPSAAAGAGPTPGVLLSRGGVASPSGDVRYVALSAGGSTVVAAVRARDGVVLRSRLVSGRFGIPLVTFNGTAGGLSADGKTLVLAPVGFAFRKATSFTVLDTKTFRVAQTPTLRGMFSFDAMSPRAETLYLVQSLAEDDPSYYQVRAYDLRARRLLATPVVDKSRPDEQMRGLPSARVTAPGARWVYTLYAGGPQPFVHALDTIGRRSICLDVRWSVAQEDTFRVRLVLSGDGRRILLLLRGKQVGSLKVPT